MWNTVEIIKHTKPKHVIWENVPNVLSDAHKHNYDKYINTLNKLGYQNYSQLINAKYWGVPQNRNRIFVVSIRKDVDEGFSFPISSLEGQMSLFNDVVEMEETVLRDILENEVDEKYYLSDEALEYMNRKVEDGRTHWDFGLHHEADKPSHAIVANIRKGVPYNVVKIPVKTADDVSNTVRSSGRGSYDIKHTWDVIYEGSRNELQQIGGIKDGKVKFNDDVYAQGQRIYNSSGIASTLRGEGGGQGGKTGLYYIDYKIRRLTPLECFRLMGFNDEDYWKVRRTLEDKYYNGNDRSDSQCYKIAGNSIVCNVLEYIFKALFHL